MKRFVWALALTCALSGAVYAGDVHSTDSPAPVPGNIPTVSATSPGEIPTTDTASPGDMGNGGLSALLAILDLVF